MDCGGNVDNTGVLFDDVGQEENSEEEMAQVVGGEGVIDVSDDGFVGV